MSMLNSFYEQTLLSFEVYEAKKGALDAFIEDDKKNADYSEYVREGIKYKQVTKKTDEYYFVRKYFHSKNFIYILTAGSKTGETTPAKRFFDSVIFKPDTKEPVNSAITVFAKLKSSRVNIENADEKDFPAPPEKPNANSQSEEENKGKLLVFHRPRPAYIDLARMNQVQGGIRLRVTFSADGFTPKILILKTLPDGLLRQAVFAALRIKFIPKQENAKFIDSEKSVEYRFHIY